MFICTNLEEITMIFRENSLLKLWAAILGGAVYGESCWARVCVKLEILSTSFKEFLKDTLGELMSGSGVD